MLEVMIFSVFFFTRSLARALSVSRVLFLLLSTGNFITICFALNVFVFGVLVSLHALVTVVEAFLAFLVSHFGLN